MVKIIQEAVESATQGGGLSRKAARIHLFANSAEGTRVQMDKAIATERAGAVMRRLLKSDR